MQFLCIICLQNRFGSHVKSQLCVTPQNLSDLYIAGESFLLSKSYRMIDKINVHKSLWLERPFSNRNLSDEARTWTNTSNMDVGTLKLKPKERLIQAVCI